MSTTRRSVSVFMLFPFGFLKREVRLAMWPPATVRFISLPDCFEVNVKNVVWLGLLHRSLLREGVRGTTSPARLQVDESPK